MSMARNKHRLMSEINVVPYIDVMLVLLIIFMITAPLLTQGITVDLPKAAAAPIDPNESQEPVVLSIDKDGNFYLNIGEKVETPVDDATVLERVGAVLRQNPQVQVLVKADERVPYGRAVAGASLLQEAGATKLGFLTDPSGVDPKKRGSR